MHDLFYQFLEAIASSSLDVDLILLLNFQENAVTKFLP
jgi:hypothetical protein